MAEPKGKSVAEKYAEDLAKKTYLSDPEGASYVHMSVPTFREWSKRIGARRKLGEGRGGKILNVRAIIDKAIMEGKNEYK